MSPTNLTLTPRHSGPFGVIKLDWEGDVYLLPPCKEAEFTAGVLRYEAADNDEEAWATSLQFDDLFGAHRWSASIDGLQVVLP